MTENAPVRKFQFIGGDLCLDFCNTMGGKREGRAKEFLESFAEFVGWCEQAGLLEKSLAAALVRKADRHPAAASATVARAIELREAIYQIFYAIFRNRTAPEPALARLNDELSRSLSRLRVVGKKGEKGRFDWQWAQADDELDQALGPVARAAAHLLVSDHAPAHVRQCGGDNCGWLFLDSSKNHSRRWCDMRDCGNRAKVRRHRLKQQCCD